MKILKEKKNSIKGKKVLWAYTRTNTAFLNYRDAGTLFTSNTNLSQDIVYYLGHWAARSQNEAMAFVFKTGKS